MRREINKELADIWATMIFEKVDKLKKSQEDYSSKMIYHSTNSETYQQLMHQCAICEAKISAYLSSISLLNRLEEGRYMQTYNKILKELEMQEGK